MATTVLSASVTSRKPSSPNQPKDGRNDGLIRQAKSQLFDLYKRDHWPSDIEELVCPNGADGGCHVKGKTRDEMCPSCATYDRLIAEFNAIPVG
jgi:hypothetical protein